MKFIYKIIAISYLLSFSNAWAQDIQIENSKWKAEWTKALIEKMDENNSSFLNNHLNSEDLNTLYCPNYLNLTHNEKKQFWIYFFSGLTKAESGFNAKIRSKAPKGGHGNYGLLQLSKRTARVLCQLSPEDVYDPIKNLKCGITLMDYQLKGAPNDKGKITKKRTLNRIFTSPIFFWGPLRKKDYRGKKVLTTWMKTHTSKLPSCQK